MALLIVKQRGLDTKGVLISGRVVAIGRAGTNDIVLTNRYTSSRHCEIRCEDGQYLIHDLDSTNGLFVNGSKVDNKILQDGDRILAGAAMLVFVADEDAIEVNALISQVRNGDAGERELAANLLGQLNMTAATGVLLKALREDPDLKVKAAAAEALGFLGETSAGKSLLAHFDTADALLRNSVVRAIIRIADDKISADVAQYLKHPEKKVRVLAAYVLGQTHGSLAAKQIQRALNDEAFEVREAAVKALGEVGDPQSVDILLKIAGQPQRYPFVWIIDSLGKIADRKALPALMTALQHQNLEVKEAAIDGLGRLRAKEAVPGLISALDDQNAKIRRAAANALEKIRKYFEVERKVSSLKGESHQTMEIAAIGERDSGVGSGEPLFGEDKGAWQNWWSIEMRIRGIAGEQ